MSKETLKFPEGFLWGSATSAYQIEGGIENNDWVLWGRKGRVPLAGGACDHYNRYVEDFDIVKSLNQNAHRFSIEWSRIEPEEGKWDLEEAEHYKKVLGALNERNITPFVTLHHFTNPGWLYRLGGWENKKAPRIFARFVEFIASKLKNDVEFWITVNEPMIYIWGGWLEGKWPPQKHSLSRAIRVYENLVKAHKLSYKKIHEIYGGKPTKVGVAKYLAAIRPYDENSILDRIISRLARYIFNYRFFDDTRGFHDFIGVNYYRPQWTKFNLFKPSNLFYESKEKSEERTDMGWEIYPQGIYQALRESKKYNLPIYITENGLADVYNKRREKFILDHLKYIHKAIQDGVDVRGYFHWSLIDNFEWADGYEPKFGLVKVDFETQKRTIRPSAYRYAEICKNNNITI